MGFRKYPVRSDYHYPCKDCVAPKRHIGCHAKCPDYQAVAEVNKYRRAAINEAKRYEEAVSHFVIENTIRSRKKRH